MSSQLAADPEHVKWLKDMEKFIEDSPDFTEEHKEILLNGGDEVIQSTFAGSAEAAFGAACFVLDLIGSFLHEGARPLESPSDALLAMQTLYDTTNALGIAAVRAMEDAANQEAADAGEMEA